MTRFKDIAIPAKFEHPDGHAIDKDGRRYFIPENMREKLGWLDIEESENLKGVLATVGRLQFTPEEEAERDAEESAFDAMKPMNDWLSKMRASDEKISRQTEDVIDWILESMKLSVDDLAEPIKNAYLDKKIKRAEKPK